MSVKPQTYSLKSYLENIKENDIRPDADTQRKFKRRASSFTDKLVKTIYSQKFNYIPPILLAEEPVNGKNVRVILDGIHRSMSLYEFFYGKHRISKTMENNIITYLRKVTDDEGEHVLDENGNFYYEETEFDLAGKVYDDFPQEMKRQFDEYQLQTVLFEECSKKEQAELVIVFNEHDSMNAAQKAFTYMDNFSKRIRTIADKSRFFKDCGKYSQNERENGTLERVVSECVMTAFYIESWNKESRKNGQFINNNATDGDFEKISEYFERLVPLCENEVGGSKKYQSIWNAKNTFLFMAVFDRFTKLGLDDSRFAEFLTSLEDNLHSKKLNDDSGETSWDILNAETGTKARSLVTRKIEFLEKLMTDYLGVSR